MPELAAFDERALDHLLRRQAHVVSRRQALSCGLTVAAFRHRIRPGGPWQRLLPGIYLAATGTPTRAQQELAALLYAGGRGVITGLAALARHGIRAPASTTVTVLVPASRTRHRQSFVRVWPTTRMPEFVCVDGPARFATPGRAVADATREVSGFRDVRAIVADAVQQGRCRLDWLAEELAGGPVRGSAPLRRALAEVTDGVRSVPEGDLRTLLERAGIPAPMFNARLFAGPAFIGIADAWWPGERLAVEVDSRQWHLSPDDWERTLRRHATMTACGITVLHFTPRQIRGEPARVLADIRAALSIGPAGRGPAIRAIPAAV